MAMSRVLRASLMKLAILLATSPICAVRSGVEMKGSSPLWRRNMIPMLPPPAGTVSTNIQSYPFLLLGPFSRARILTDSQVAAVRLSIQA